MRIEDIDGARSRAEWADEFRADLAWLGLAWREVPAQSTRLAGYRAALEQFAQRGLIKGVPLVQARSAGESMSAMEAYFAPKPKFPFSINTDILRLTGPK